MLSAERAPPATSFYGIFNVLIEYYIVRLFFNNNNDNNW